jgi:hypothetical protein
MKRDKGRLPAFVPLLKETLASPAWKAMSHGARSLYIALKLRYSSNFKNNGKLYLSQREAAEEIGSKTAQVTRWFRELQHYGFIVMMVPGCLGSDGKGKAPHWRLTEVGYMTDLPTRDFMRWDGVPLAPQKQNPVPEKGDTPSPKRGTYTVPEKGDTSWNKRPRKGGHTARWGVPEKGDITCIPLGGRQRGALPGTGRAKLPWTTPTLPEVNDPVEAAAIRKACE